MGCAQGKELPNSAPNDPNLENNANECPEIPDPAYNLCCCSCKKRLTREQQHDLEFRRNNCRNSERLISMHKSLVSTDTLLPHMPSLSSQNKSVH
ncbi:unnamed protein product [Dibothriocephalus latus]|uniref:Uncharacterized protein n=1 Tax=Dibothriocephalus latus TaxID=60516 RepID=A0A3P7MA61_DIBLA|nr:unnamed protein product [Dibothriocephalus latus]